MTFVKRSFLSILLLAAPNNSLFSHNSCTPSCSTAKLCTSSCDNSCASSCNNSCNECSCHSVFIPRSSNSNSAYKWLYQAHDPYADTWYAIFDFGFEYQRSFSGQDIATCMFGNNILRFQGSQVTNRANTSLMADYFGLSPLADVQITLKPRIENFNFHAMSYFGFDQWVPGLYAGVNFTLTGQKRSLLPHYCPLCPLTDNIPTQTTFPAGYMSVGEAASAPSLKSVLNGSFLFGDMKTPWQFGRFNFDCDQTLTKIAGVDILFGYDFLRCERNELGVFLLYTAPTGNTPNPAYVFSPVVGNGKHHELGAGIHAQWGAWRSSNNPNEHITMYLDGSISHMFKNCQMRSFDLKNHGCMSRYMLLKILTPTTGVAEYAFEGNIINAINWTTRNTDVSVNVKGDATLRMLYTNGGFNVGIGYNLYGQSAETVCIKGFTACNKDLANVHVGIKGCSGDYTYIYNYDTQSSLVTGPATPAYEALNTTQNNANIFSCGNNDNPVILLNSQSNTVGVAWNNATPANTVTDGTNINTLTLASTSAPALILSTTDLDARSGAAPRQITNKGFIDINYTWLDCKECCVTPHVGFGVEIEGGSCNCDLKEWGVWLRGGLEF